MVIASIVAVHLAMSAWCAWLYYRRARKMTPDDMRGVRFETTQTFIWCLCGMWFIVPEIWDNSWMDKYID